MSSRSFLPCLPSILGSMAKPSRVQIWVVGCGLLAVALPFFVGAVLSFVARHQPWSIPKSMGYVSPAETPGRGLWVRYLGVSGYEISDGATTLILDPGLTRPRVVELLTGPIDPDPDLSARLTPKADFVLVNHAHYDHILDAPEILRRTDATMVGSRSTGNLALARGLPPAQVRVVEPGDRVTLGSFLVEVGHAEHSPAYGFASLAAGVIPPDAGPLWMWEYAADASYSYRISGGGASILFHVSSQFVAERVSAVPVGTVFLGVAGKKLSEATARDVMSRCRPQRVFPTHYDNFFQPVDAGLALLPGLDLDAVAAIFRKVAPEARFGVLDYGERIYLPPDRDEAEPVAGESTDAGSPPTPPDSPP